jgi:hypothetical protein
MEWVGDRGHNWNQEKWKAQPMNSAGFVVLTNPVEDH